MKKLFSNKINYQVSYAILIALSIPLVINILNARPVSDDYCFAYIALNHDPFHAALLWNKYWSFSGSYLFFESVWHFANNSITASRIFLILTYLISYFIIQIYLPKSRAYVKLSLYLLMISSTAIINVFNFTFNFPLHFSSLITQVPFAALKQIFPTNIDGQIYIWLTTVPLAWMKLISFSFLLGFFYSIKSQKNTQAIFALTYFLFYGMNLETLIAFSYVTYLLINRIYKKNVTKQFFLLLSFLLAFFVEVAISGISKRMVVNDSKNLMEIFNSSIGILIFLTASYFIICFVTYIPKVYLNNNYKNDLLNYNNTASELRILLLISAFVTSLFGGMFYINSYHWIAFVMLSIMHAVTKELKSKKFTFAIISLLPVFITLNNIYSSVITADNRANLWDIRKNTSISSSIRSYNQIPLLNNNRKVLSYDQSELSSSIIPQFGIVKNHTKFCFSRLKSNW